jgi:hypothetical protein
MKRDKLNIRLPEDDEDGPNPYDSRTDVKHQFPRWIWDWRVWSGAICVGIAYYFVGKFNGRW